MECRPHARFLRCISISIFCAYCVVLALFSELDEQFDFPAHRTKYCLDKDVPESLCMNFHEFLLHAVYILQKDDVDAKKAVLVDVIVGRANDNQAMTDFLKKYFDVQDVQDLNWGNLKQVYDVHIANNGSQDPNDSQHRKSFDMVICYHLSSRPYLTPIVLTLCAVLGFMHEYLRESNSSRCCSSSPLKVMRLCFATMSAFGLAGLWIWPGLNVYGGVDHVNGSLQDLTRVYNKAWDAFFGPERILHLGAAGCVLFSLIVLSASDVNRCSWGYWFLPPTVGCIVYFMLTGIVSLQWLAVLFICIWQVYILLEPEELEPEEDCQSVCEMFCNVELCSQDAMCCSENTTGHGTDRRPDSHSNLKNRKRIFAIVVFVCCLLVPLAIKLLAGNKYLDVLRLDRAMIVTA